MTKRALFIVSTQGQGHLVRCRALASELATRGWRSTMTSRAPLSAASCDVSIVDLGNDPGAPDVYRALSGRPVVAVVDTYCDVEADLVVFGGAPRFHWIAGNTKHMGVTLYGPAYALLRPEFRARRGYAIPPTNYFDARNVKDLSADFLALCMLSADTVRTYGGMRAMEAACVRGNAVGLEIEARNEGEALNKSGLLADPTADLVDGLGCVRVADQIERMVAA